jgi:hypothetical protein
VKERERGERERERKGRERREKRGGEEKERDRESKEERHCLTIDFAVVQWKPFHGRAPNVTR